MRSLDARRRMSEAMKAAWADPVVRERQREAKRQWARTPEGQAQLARASAARRLKMPPGITRSFYDYLRRILGAEKARKQLGMM